MSGIDPGLWRDALSRISDRAVTAVLTVQCALDWLRPETFGLRDEIDTAVIGAAVARRDLSVDRVVLHNLPALASLPAGELAELNAAHEDWLYRLAVAGALLPGNRRPRVHRLIVRGSQRSVGLMDGIELGIRGAALHPEAAAAREIMRSGATTPLTSYDIDMDGPFGDSDPSVYL